MRIEDIDTTRCRPEYTQAIYQDLAWLGLTWPQPVRVQSEHFADYDAVVRSLTDRGLTYRCFRTRQQLTYNDKGGVESAPLPKAEEAERLKRGDPFAWRLSLAACRKHLGALAYDSLTFQVEQGGALQTIPADPSCEGDIVLARKDSPSAYHVAATHDDALQGITHVIRGEDLLTAPHIQRLLQVLMDWPAPLYRYHKLITGPDGARLSKRAKSTALASCREAGMTRADIMQQIGRP